MTMLTNARGKDRKVHNAISRMSTGVSPFALALAWTDWGLHFWTSPDKQSHVIEHARDEVAQDKQFAGEEWQKWPFNFYAQSHTAALKWWTEAVTHVPGVSRHDEDLLAFTVRQFFEAASPKNSPFTNPDVIKKTQESKGQNFVKGYQNFLEDLHQKTSGAEPIGTENFIVGKDVATTPGKVVFKNRLIELIQYTPTTKTVYAQPVLIVPACIMKYYILDLSAQNSMVKYLVGQGHTVFMISWKNPGKEDSETTLQDYVDLGVMGAINATSDIVQGASIHAAGYCIGGTLLSMAAATMARDEDTRLASVTLLAAQTDFTECGELGLFIDEAQIHSLDHVMAEKGYLEGPKMAGAFQLLHSTGLLWSAAIKRYLMGEESAMIDLMAWNADATRLPHKMHTQYLHDLFLNNDLAEARYLVGGRPICLRDLRIPIFAVGTVTDHVAPWKSVYKINRLASSDVTFVRTSGGHNAGIVSEPGHKRRYYQMTSRFAYQKYVDPDTWAATAPKTDGSWWTAWSEWLADQSGGGVVPPVSEALYDAPGEYVLQR